MPQKRTDDLIAALIYFAVNHSDLVRRFLAFSDLPEVELERFERLEASRGTKSRDEIAKTVQVDRRRSCDELLHKSLVGVMVFLEGLELDEVPTVGFLDYRGGGVGSRDDRVVSWGHQWNERDPCHSDVCLCRLLSEPTSRCWAA
jgi:hypothetical protein